MKKPVNIPVVVNWVMVVLACSSGLGLLVLQLTVGSSFGDSFGEYGIELPLLTKWALSGWFAPLLGGAILALAVAGLVFAIRGRPAVGLILGGGSLLFAFASVAVFFYAMGLAVFSLSAIKP